MTGSVGIPAVTENETAIGVLEQWAQAIRGDWGSIDGRSCRSELQAIAAQLRGETHHDVTKLRGLAGVCPHGGGHWPEYCPDYCEVSDV